MTTRKELEAAISREIQEWPGVGVEFVEGAKHPRARLSFGGNMLSATYPGTPSTPSSVHATVGEVRRTLKRLGAARSAPPPKDPKDEAYNKPNDGRARRKDPIVVEKVDPKPDVIDQLVEAGLASEKGAADARRRKRGDVVSEKTAIHLERTRPDLAPLRVKVDPGVEHDGWGLYTDIPAEAYHLDPCPEPSISNSLMDAMLTKTARDFAWAHPRRTELVPEWPEEDEEAKEKALALIRGDVVHQLALAKGRGIAIADYNDWRTKDAKAFRRSANEDGVTAILRKEYDKAKPLADRIVEAIKQALDGADYETEVVFMYQERTQFGPVWVRGMMDVWCPERAIILDPKITGRLYDGEIEKHAVAMGWDRQSALYTHAVGQIIPELNGRVEFWDLLLNPDPPFVSRQWAPEKAWEFTSVRECMRAIDRFAWCMQAKEWPEFGNSPQRGKMPPWEEKRRMEIEEG